MHIGYLWSVCTIMNYMKYIGYVVYKMACVRYVDFICELHRMCEHIVYMGFVECALCIPWSTYGLYEYMWHMSGICRCTWGLWGLCNI